MWSGLGFNLSDLPNQCQVQTGDIGTNVLKSRDRNADRSLTLIRERLPRFMHALGRDFAGVPGSRVYLAIQKGELSYRLWCLRKD